MNKRVAVVGLLMIVAGLLLTTGGQAQKGDGNSPDIQPPAGNYTPLPLGGPFAYIGAGNGYAPPLVIGGQTYTVTSADLHELPLTNSYWLSNHSAGMDKNWGDPSPPSGTVPLVAISATGRIAAATRRTTTARPTIAASVKATTLRLRSPPPAAASCRCSTRPSLPTSEIPRSISRPQCRSPLCRMKPR